jgi:L-ascorbate metabolism protein UlaG (beta-lactamase superfamily)
MKITYYGHSAFLLEAHDGTRVIVDPYVSGSFNKALRYRPIEDEADIVVATHAHDDHGGIDTIPGDSLRLLHPTAARKGAVEITGIPAKHDVHQGKDRGDNTMVVIDDGDLRVAHLGDLGHELDESFLALLGDVDVLLIPVGGFFTIDAHTAAKVVRSIQPRVVIPMHYLTDSVSFPITGVDPFLKTQKNVKREDGSTLELTKATLPRDQTVIVLRPSHAAV